MEPLGELQAKLDRRRLWEMQSSHDPPVVIPPPSRPAPTAPPPSRPAPTAPVVVQKTMSNNGGKTLYTLPVQKTTSPPPLVKQPSSLSTSSSTASPKNKPKSLQISPPITKLEKIPLPYPVVKHHAEPPPALPDHRPVLKPKFALLPKQTVPPQHPAPPPPPSAAVTTTTAPLIRSGSLKADSWIRKNTNEESSEELSILKKIDKKPSVVASTTMTAPTPPADPKMKPVFVRTESVGSIPVRPKLTRHSSNPAGSPINVTLPTTTTTTSSHEEEEKNRHITNKEFNAAVLLMEDLRPVLTHFYEKHNKVKLPSVDKILASFGLRGRELGELQLNQALKREYGVDLSDFNSSGTNKSFVPPVPATASTKDTSLFRFVKSLYKFTPLQEGDLSFEAGQVIQVTDSSKDWWMGTYKLGDKTLSGAFPRNYVMDIEEAVALNLLAKQRLPTVVVSSSSAVQGKGGEKISTAKVIATAPSSNAADVAEEFSIDREEYPSDLIKNDLEVTHYFKSVLEVVTSEFKYVIDLHLVNTVFVNKFLSSNSVRTSKYANELFPSWQSIVFAHENILGRLMEALPDSKEILSEFYSAVPAGQSQEKANRHSMSKSTEEYIIDQVCSDSAAKLKAFQFRLGVLEETFSLCLESGKFFTPKQRVRRTEIVSQWVLRQSQELSNLIPFLKMSNQFILQYHSTLKKLELFSGEDLQFVNKLEAHPAMKNMKLRDFLIKPIQRVCKYPLLYREIIKYAPEEETKQAARLTQDKFMLITEQVNTMIKQGETNNAKRMEEILSLVHPSSDLIKYDLNAMASLKREGDISVASVENAKEIAGLLQEKSPLVGLLISDSLLFCEKQVVNRLLVKAENRLKVHYAIRFGSLEFERVTVSKHASEQELLELTLFLADSGAANKWTFRLPSVACRDGWVEDLSFVAERSENARVREKQAQKHEMRKSLQRPSRNMGGSHELPAPPPRKQNVLMGLVDELKSVQVFKGINKDEV